MIYGEVRFVDEFRHMLCVLSLTVFKHRLAYWLCMPIQVYCETFYRPNVFYTKVRCARCVRCGVSSDHWNRPRRHRWWWQILSAAAHNSSTVFARWHCVHVDLIHMIPWPHMHATLQLDQFTDVYRADVALSLYTFYCMHCPIRSFLVGYEQLNPIQCTVPFVPLAHPTHHPKQQLDRLSRFYTIHARYQRPYWRTDRTTTAIPNRAFIRCDVRWC